MIFRILSPAVLFAAAAAGGTDARNIETGRRIPDEGYCDQPYIVVTGDGNWLCTLTTGPGKEGQGGQHIAAAISADRGKTWSPLIAIEPADGPVASWACPLVTPAGRVYVFYTYNGDRIDLGRNDVHGWYCFRYSDDGGRTWSPRRRIPMRITACDRDNPRTAPGGKPVQMFWGIDKPSVAGTAVYFAFTKLGRYFLKDGEGWVYRSDNILSARDPAAIRWRLLPAGDRGIRGAAFGSVQEEHNLVPLGPGRLYCVYRTTKGYPCHTRSADGGETWEEPVPMTYRPGGRIVKQPRACPKLWKTKNGRYLFWYHLNGGHGYRGRNPAWVSGGVAQGGTIHWSEPEILLYHRDPAVRMSYPDLVEQDGRYWVTETQKTVARVHEIDPSLLAGLWNQGTVKTVARDGLLLAAGPGTARLPGPLDVSKTGGIAVDCWIDGAVPPGRVLADTRDEKGRGLALVAADGGAVSIALNDGTRSVSWTGDPGMTGPGEPRHVCAIVDDGPRIVAFVAGGTICDGGEHRTRGWGRYAASPGDVAGAGTITIDAAVQRLRIYGRPLRISEAVGNHGAGPPADKSR